MSKSKNSIIEAAYLLGFEPSSDSLTGDAIYKEAMSFLEKSILF
jgi:hypothetical protein